MLPVVVLGAALVLVALASHVVPPKYGHDQPPRPAAESGSSSPTPTSVLPTRRGFARTTSHPLAIDIASYILLGIIAVGLVWGVVNLVLTRVRAGRREWRRRPGPDRGAAAAQLAARIETAVDEGLDELAQGPVADAIVACWLRLEDAAGHAGVPMRRSDTPAETAMRVLELGSGQRVRPEPLERLAGLYREARFSRHVMGEPARSSARAALEDIRADLATGGDDTPAGGGRA